MELNKFELSFFAFSLLHAIMSYINIFILITFIASGLGLIPLAMMTIEYGTNGFFICILIAFFCFFYALAFNEMDKKMDKAQEIRKENRCKSRKSGLLK